MISEYYLPGFFQGNKGNEALLSKYPITLFPKTHLFLFDTTAFYEKYFPTIQQFMLREKRFIQFETPNRALITHEYDIHIKGYFDYSKFYYLFNPTSRLDWLKISQDNKRVSVIRERPVIEKIKQIVEPELKANNLNVDFLTDIWNNKTGYPCFIKFEKVNSCGDFLLSATYYDSLVKKVETRVPICKLFEERKLLYDYHPLQNRSSWLYVKAPDKFQIRIEQKEINYPEFVQIGKKNNVDPEKLSVTIIGTQFKNLPSIKIPISIVIPLSQKWWFES